MKISATIYLSLILSASFVSYVDAANEDMNRSNPRCNPLTKSNLNDPVPNYMTIKDSSIKLPTCVKPKKQTTSTLAASSVRPQSSLQSGGTRATDYNSSRSNKQGVYQDGDDLVLRKRPGRTTFTPSGNCPTPKNGEMSQTKPTCLAKK